MGVSHRDQESLKTWSHPVAPPSSPSRHTPLFASRHTPLFASPSHPRLRPKNDDPKNRNAHKLGQIATDRDDNQPEKSREDRSSPQWSLERPRGSKRGRKWTDTFLEKVQNLAPLLSHPPLRLPRLFNSLDILYAFYRHCIDTL